MYRRCLAGDAGPALTAHLISLYYDAPYAIHCEAFAPRAERDLLDPYQELLFERGRAWEEAYRAAAYPGAQPIPFSDEREGFREALRAMAEGVPALFGMPLFYLPEGVKGRPDILVRDDGHASLFGPFHYGVTEVKAARHIREAHVLQAAFYTDLIGKIQGTTPERLTLINGEGAAFLHRFDQVAPRLRAAVAGTRAILQGNEAVTPTRGTCPWPWGGLCDRQAAAARDVSLLNGVSLATKQTLVAAGFRRVDDVAAAEPHVLATLPRLGPARAVRMIRQARAILAGRPLPIDRALIALPEAPIELSLDLEGTDQGAGADDILGCDYLIGVLIREGGAERYRPFVARGPAEEGKMYREFLDFVVPLGDVPIYHWHSYERTHLKKLALRHRTPPAIHEAIEGRLIDLHALATRAVALPTPGGGLKEVARFCGFRWRQADVDATASIVLYLRYVEDPAAREDLLRKILAYNEDDCRATLAVKDWLARYRREAATSP